VYLTFTLSSCLGNNSPSKLNDMRHPPSFANKSVISGGIISSGKSSRKSVESTSSSCKQKCTCKCLVSLIKCNLNFKSKGQLNKSSQSASSSSSTSMSNGVVIGAAAGPAGLFPEDSCTLKSKSRQSTIKTIQSDSESRFWSILNRTSSSPPSESSSAPLRDTLEGSNNQIKDGGDNNILNSTRINDIHSKHSNNSAAGEPLINDNEGVEFIEKKNEKNDFISAKNLTPIDSLNISDLNVIISSGINSNNGESNNLVSKDKSKGLVSSKLPFGWMKRKNSKCRSSVSSSKRLSSIKRNSRDIYGGKPGGVNKSDSTKKSNKAAIAAQENGESSSSNRDLCTTCVIL